LARSFQRVLRRAVVTVARDTHAPPHRAHVDDRAAALLAHARQHGLDHANRAEVVRLEHGLRELERALLDGPAATDAGVVDEHVDATGTAEYLAYATVDRRGVVDVEHDRANGQLLAVDRLGQLARGGDVPNARVHLV